MKPALVAVTIAVPAPERHAASGEPGGGTEHVSSANAASVEPGGGTEHVS
jgi:hypothetical protein